MDANEVFFEVVDSKGRRIVCTKDQWTNHVCFDNHEYMDSCKAEVINALTNPDYGVSYFDKDFMNRRVYYKSARTKDYYTKVIVELDGDHTTGHVITAYQPDSMPDGEIVEL